MPNKPRGGDESLPPVSYLFGLKLSKIYTGRTANHGTGRGPRHEPRGPAISALAAARRFLLLLFTLLAQDRFARQANLVAFDGEDLDEDLVA